MKIECPHCGWSREVDQPECEKTKCRCPKCKEIFTIDHTKEQKKMTQNNHEKGEEYIPPSTNTFILRLATGLYLVFGSLGLLLHGIQLANSHQTETLGYTLLGSIVIVIMTSFFLFVIGDIADNVRELRKQ